MQAREWPCLAPFPSRIAMQRHRYAKPGKSARLTAEGSFSVVACTQCRRSHGARTVGTAVIAWRSMRTTESGGSPEHVSRGRSTPTVCWQTWPLKERVDAGPGAAEYRPAGYSQLMSQRFVRKTEQDRSLEHASGGQARLFFFPWAQAPVPRLRSSTPEPARTRTNRR